jgi:hypothetical protein
MQTSFLEYENKTLCKSEGVVKKMGVFEKVYSLQQEEKRYADCNKSQNGGERAFGTGCLKI